MSTTSQQTLLVCHTIFIFISFPFGLVRDRFLSLNICSNHLNIKVGTEPK